MLQSQDITLKRGACQDLNQGKNQNRRKGIWPRRKSKLEFNSFREIVKIQEEITVEDKCISIFYLSLLAFTDPVINLEADTIKQIYTTEDMRERQSHLDLHYDSQDLHSLQEEFKLTEEPSIENHCPIPERRSDDYGLRFSRKDYIHIQYDNIEKYKETDDIQEIKQIKREKFLKSPVVVILVNVKQYNSIKISKQEQKWLDWLAKKDFKELVDNFLKDLSEAIFLKISTEAERENNKKEAFSIIVENYIHPAIQQKLLSFISPNRIFGSIYPKSLSDLKKHSTIFGVLKIGHSWKNNKLVSTMTQWVKTKQIEPLLENETDYKSKWKEIIFKFVKYHFKKYRVLSDKYILNSKDCKHWIDKKRILKLDEKIKVLPVLKSYSKWLTSPLRKVSSKRTEVDNVLKYEIWNKKYKAESEYLRVNHIEGLLKAEVNIILKNNDISKKLFGQ